MAETFAIVPAALNRMWLVPAILAIVFAGVIFLVTASIRGARSSTFEISSAGLQIRGDLYGRLVPKAAIRADEARLVDLRTDPSVAPRRRRVGTALPGYSAGWFRLANGEKALVYLTDRTRALYVPTTEGYSLLLSPQRPERLLERIQTWGNR